MSLLSEVLDWMQLNNYRRVSFERLTATIPSANNYTQLDALVRNNPDIFRTAKIVGGLPGLALVDGYRFPLKDIPVSSNNVPATRGFLNTPIRVTEDDVNNSIMSEHYVNVGNALDYEDYFNGYSITTRPISLSLLTICILVLKNGYTVTGKSACVSPDLYNKKLSQELARKQAVQKIWPLLGFRLADSLNTPETFR